MATSRIFVGFASQPPTLADTIRTASLEIGKVGGVDLRIWEDLRVAGNLLLPEIESAIRDADLSIFDLTQLNENVLFELGIAIGADRVVWPLRDFSDEARKAEWNAIGLLDQLGQVRFSTHEDIVGAFMEERPDVQGKSLFKTALEPLLKSGWPPSMFYLAEQTQTDAGRAVLQLLGARSSTGLPLVSADPSEAAVQTLPWFTQHVYASEAVVVHMMAARKRGSAVHNARASLVAGLARGMGRPLLMLAESEYESALDYRDLLFRYEDAASCRTRVDHWLGRTLEPLRGRVAEAKEAASALRLSTELRSVDLGEYVAENEVSGLERYYVETASFREILSGASRVYVGSKGTGKSAAAISAEAAIRADARKLVCTIKPPGYDLNGLVRLFTHYEERDTKGYVAESLWKYLLATELALAVERDLSRRPAGAVPGDPEWKLLQFISENEEWIKRDFASRLELAVADLVKIEPGVGVADVRNRISEVLHRGPLRRLREVLAPALADRERISILVDNLDKAWDKEADAPQLSRLLLGLLSCMDSFRQEMERAVSGGALQISLSLFLRSDIFATVSTLAREPDKLPVRRIDWPAEADLLDVVGQRYVASRSEDVPPEELWSRYFCPSVGSDSTTSWILDRCLPRPRDVLYLTRAAIDQAVSRRHPVVQEADLLSAELEYSRFAFSAALVEGQQRVPRIEDILIEFAGAPVRLNDDQLTATLEAAGIDRSETARTIEVLRDLSFLGIVVGPDECVYTDVPRDKQLAEVRSKRQRKKDESLPAYSVHPAFWAYLELEREDGRISLRF
jgi:hypothetical protein